MEDLYQQQNEISEAIRKIPINIGKDGADRKSDDYFKKRLDWLEKYWSEFQDNHVAICGIGIKDHKYFVESIYEQVKQSYLSVKIFIDDKREQFASKKMPWTPIARPQPPSIEQQGGNRDQELPHCSKQQQQQQLPILESRGSTSKWDDMIRKQAANFKAFKRTITFMDLEYLSEKWELQDALKTLEARWSRIDSLHWELNGEIDAEDDEYEAIFSQHEQSYLKWKQALNKKLFSVSQKEHSTPKMEIPEFSGSFKHWTSFKDLFTEAIHNNPALSKAQKMQFLKGKVKGEAQGLIQHLAISTESYDACWEILNHRYNNERLIFISIMHNLLSLPNTQQRSIGQIKKLHDVTLETMYAIRNLGIDISTWDPILVYLLSQKLDTETYDDYNDSLKNKRQQPSLQEFLDYLESKFTGWETSRRRLDQTAQKCNNQATTYSPENNKSKRNNNHYSNYKYYKPHSFSKALHVSNIKCQLCNQQHAIYNCEKFLALHNDNKLNTISKFKLCKNCLFDHNGQQCISVRRCRKCAGKHHSILHDACTKNVSQSNTATTVTSETIAQQQQVAMTAYHSESSLGTNEVLLATALVKVAAIDGSYQVLRALIDPGSQVSLIKESAAKKLGWHRSKFNGVIFGIGEVENNCNGKVTLTCLSTYNDFSFTTDVLIMSNILNDIPSKSFDTSKWSYLENFKLADPHYNVSRPVDLLLSAQVSGIILLGGLIKGENSSLPVLQETYLGWIISGGGEVSPYRCNVVMNSTHDLQKFWEIQDIGEDSNMSSEDQQCVDYYMSSTTRREDGRYVVKLPLKPDIDEKLGSSKQIAIAQFKNMERKFLKQPVLAEQYKTFIREYIALGHMVPSYNYNNNPVSCYLPHHSVQRSESATTKLRVVFNASARTSSGYCLNDFMFKGPNLQRDILELLLKWRQYRYAFTSDIEKMYRQIMVCESDQRYQKIIWREAQEKPLETFSLTTVTYGTKSAPFLAMMTLRRLASDERATFPEASKVLEESCYMDDIVHGSHSITKGQQLIENLNKLLKSGGFTLRKWCTNEPELLQNIEQSNEEIIFNFKSDSLSKTLGLRWNSSNDNFTFKYDLCSAPAKITKRLLLSEISKIFDPLGWLSPITTKLKLLFQQLWLNKMHWDEEVPESIKKEWQAISTDLINLNQCEIPRWIGYQPSDVIELHGYCDASTKAYAAVIYARLQRADERLVTLLVAKTRLAPVSKNISLPRLELLGAYLLAKLIQKVTSCLSELDIRIYGWTDSMVVLGWLQGDHSRWKPFVANRSKFITAIMKPSCWRYVASKDNPADAASRGISVSQLNNQALWWHGPQSLESFDDNIYKSVTYSTNQEIKSKFIANKVNYIQKSESESIISKLLHKHSSISKVIQVLAWILRAIKVIKFKKNEGDSTHINLPAYLTISELKHAKLLLVKSVQRSEFSQEVISLKTHGTLPNRNSLLKLNPFLDFDGILRVGGRLSKAHISTEMKHPAILPHCSRLTTLLIQQAHELTFHGGPRLTLFNLRQNYWIIGGNRAVKKEVRNCVICKKHKPKMHHQLMGELPEPRTNPAPPFYHTAVDYTGYVDIKLDKRRGSRTTKGYIALFICMATKAVHIELVSDLSSSAFLAALRRMAGRRGAPQHLYSDNGTNFVGANRMLQESYHDFECTFDSSFFAELTNMQIEWHFTVPSWPNSSGLVERGVASMKGHLKRVIGEQKLTFEEFTTILIQIEACLNARPLCSLSEDVEDLDVLTPAHFLIGRSGTNVIETQEDARTRWHLTAKITNDIWKRWKVEYLTQLSTRFKWKSVQENLKIGDLVTIQDDNLPPGKWMMGRIVEIHPGQDGLVRAVSLKTKGGIIKRPVVKLSKLPIEPASSITENECLRQPEQHKSKHKKLCMPKSSFATLALSLLFFISIFTKTQGAFNIASLPNNNSLYFDSVDRMQLIRDKWNLIVYYDMSPYWEGNTAARKFVEYLNKLCSSLSDKRHCNTITIQLNHDYKELQHYNTLMLNQHFEVRHRQRRGLINGIGYVANSLFGVLDERFAEQYAKDIQMVKRNELHLVNLLRNQTSVVEAEYNILKRTEQTIQLQHKTINKHLNALDNASNVLKKEVENLEAVQDYVLSTITAINLIQNLRRIQDSLLDTITDIYHGKFDTHLLTPEQLQRELLFISGQLSQDVTLPVENIPLDLKYVYSMLRVKTRMLEDYFIFEITFPLTSRDSYKIYNILPVPQQIHNDMVSLVPIADFVAINLRKDAFFTMSIWDLQLCSHNEHAYLCEVKKPINHLTIEEKFCQLDSKLKQCSVIRSPCRDSWSGLNDNSRYYYFCCNTCVVRIICQDQVAIKHMTGAGIIDLDAKCVIKGNDFTLHSHATSTNSMNLNSGIPTPQIAELNHIVNVSLSHYTQYTDPLNTTLDKLGEQIDQLKSANSNLSDDTLSTHDIHQYTICYSLLGAALVLVVYLCWKKRRTTATADLSPNVVTSVVFPRKQSTADRQPSEVNSLSENTPCNQDKATSPIVKKCRFIPVDD